MNAADLHLASDALAEFVDELDWSEETAALAREIATAVETHQVASGHPPQVTAAASAYIAGLLQNEKRTQARIARVADCSPASLRNHYRELLPVVDDTDITHIDLSPMYQDDDTGRQDLTAALRRNRVIGWLLSRGGRDA